MGKDAAIPEIPPQTVRLRDRDGDPVWVVISGTLKDGLLIDASMPSAAQVSAYLRGKGYRRLGQGPYGSLWGVNRHEIAVPDRDGDPYATEGAVDRIAHAEGRPRHEAATEILAAGTGEDGAGVSSEHEEGT